MPQIYKKSTVGTVVTLDPVRKVEAVPQTSLVCHRDCMPDCAVSLPKHRQLHIQPRHIYPALSDMDICLMGRTQPSSGSHIEASVSDGFQWDECPEAVNIMMAVKQQRQKQLFSPLKERQGSKDVWDTFTLEGIQ